MREWSDGAALGAPTLQTDGLIRFQRGGFDINMSVYEYSGPQENSFDGPKSVQNNASVFNEGRRICVRGTWISNKAGIVVIKLTVSYNGVILGQHDFLIGWMAVNSATWSTPAPSPRIRASCLATRRTSRSRARSR